MSVKRTLVDCAVLSLQDACVFYPCCKGCFSRVDVEQQDTTRCRCSKCGYSCLREQVDYRYRLSLRVARDGCIFGVTVFGTCLNQFFGIHASGLQRLVENLDGPVGAADRSTLLLKAVEDCFIGRHFIFGIKVNETESGPWFGGPAANVSSRKDTAHFIASQMILPKAAGLGGCTVVSYYRILLQKAAEYDASKTSRPPATTLLLIPRNSQASSFNNGTLLSLSLQRSQCNDSSVTPTPPWQQSLGLVTSSAEQEEGCSTQGGGDEGSTLAEDFSTPHHTQRGCLQDGKVTGETERSPCVSLACSSYTCPSLAKYPRFSIGKTLRDSPSLNTWLSPSPPGCKSSKRKDFTTRELSETPMPSSMAWEDLPFSESLTEFLCGENNDFHIVGETEQHAHVQNQEETPTNSLENTSRQNKNLSIASTSACYRSTRLTHGYSGISLDITNAPAQNGGDGHDLSDQVCKNPTGCVNKHECDHEDEEGDIYDCSADLFSSSLMIDMSTKQLNTNTDTVSTAADKQHPRSEKADVQHSTPDKQKLKSNKCFNRDSLIPPGTQDLDFIPPSQSTPIVKVCGSTVSSYRTLRLVDFTSQPDKRDSSAFHRNLSELDSKQAAKTNSSLRKLTCFGANRLCQDGYKSAKENLVRSETSSRHSHGLTPERRFWRPDRHKNRVLAQQHLRDQRGALNTGSTNHKCDTRDCDVTVCDYEDGEATIVPPTPAAKSQLSVKLRRRRRRQTDDSSSALGNTWEGQKGDGFDSKRTAMDQTSSQSGRTQTGNCDSETIDEVNVNGSNSFLLDDENRACDWSRDLFSDSV